jgi:hypothetical protein
MKTFTDTEGRLWNVKGTLPAFLRIKTATGVDMLDLPTTQQCLRRLGDPFTLGQVLYLMCQEQVDSRGLTPDQFTEGFNADVLHAASEALIEETIFFCRKEVRPALEMALQKGREAERRITETMQARIGSLGREMDAALESYLTSIGSASSYAESSESAPETGRSDNSSGQSKPGKKRRGTTPAA